MADTAFSHIWVPTLLLYLAMDTKDLEYIDVRNKHRGIICVFDRKKPVAKCLKGLKKYIPQFKRIIQ